MNPSIAPSAREKSASPGGLASRSTSPSSTAVRHVQGRSGPVELRQADDGFWQIWPRPTPESQRQFYAEDFYDKDHVDYLEKADRERAYWNATWSMRRRLMEDALPGDRRRILDVGSSGGFLLDHFRGHGWTVEGIEPSRTAAAWARERYGLEVFAGGLLDYPAPEPQASFDVIHSAQVLEHVLEPEACVERMADLLAPGGLVYIEVPNDFSLLQEVACERLGKESWWVAPKDHLNYFDYASLSALLARFGLTEVDRLASFPMEIFLLMGDDYVGDASIGSACHDRRMNFERSMIETDRVTDLLAIYRSFAQASIGRTCGVLAKKAKKA